MNIQNSFPRHFSPNVPPKTAGGTQGGCPLLFSDYSHRFDSASIFR